MGKVGYQMGRFRVFMPRSSRFSVWPRRLFRFVGEGFTAPAGAFRRPTAAQRRLLGRRSRPRVFTAARGFRDDASIVPYMGFRYRRVCCFPVCPQHLSRSVGAGIYCARRRVSEANRRAAAALRPEIPPAGVCAGAGCGGMRASRPTVVPYVPHQPGTPRVSDARNLCRGGFHCARRRVSEAKDRRSGS